MFSQVFVLGGVMKEGVNRGRPPPPDPEADTPSDLETDTHP